MLLGSLRILREPTEDEIANAGMILNRFAHTMAFIVTMTDEHIPRDFALGDIDATLTNHRASIVLNIHNPIPRVASGVSVTARIFDAVNGSQVHYHAMDSVDFAPNAIFPFGIVDQASEGIITAGEYRANVVIQHGEHRWEFDQYFTITDAQIAALAQEVAGGEPQPTGVPAWIIWTSIAVGFLLAALCVFLLIVRFRDKQNRKIEMLERQIYENMNGGQRQTAAVADAYPEEPIKTQTQLQSDSDIQMKQQLEIQALRHQQEMERQRRELEAATRRQQEELMQQQQQQMMQQLLQQQQMQAQFQAQQAPQMPQMPPQMPQMPAQPQYQQPSAQPPQMNQATMQQMMQLMLTMQAQQPGLSQQDIMAQMMRQMQGNNPPQFPQGQRPPQPTDRNGFTQPPQR
jgi:hypothetical protein